MVDGVVLREGVRVVCVKRLVCAGELLELGGQGGEVLGAEGGEGRQGVGDSQERVFVVGDFEVRGTLGDELGCVSMMWCCVLWWAAMGRTAAGSSSRSILSDYL